MSPLKSLVWFLVLAGPGAFDVRAADPVMEAFAQFEERRGTGWLLRRTGGGGAPRLLFGSRADVDQPALGSLGPESAARAWIADVEPIFGIADSVLQVGRVQPLSLAKIGAADKVAVEFAQVVRGVPVHGGGASVLLDPTMALLAIDWTGVAGLERHSVVPRVGPDAAEVEALRGFLARSGRPAERRSEPTLAFLPNADRSNARLVYVVELESSANPTHPEERVRMFMSADEPIVTLVHAEPLIHHQTAVQMTGVPAKKKPTPGIKGLVGGNATTNLAPDAWNNPPAPLPVPSIRVTSPVGEAVTDAAGSFTIPTSAISSPVPVTVTLDGPWARVTTLFGAPLSDTENIVPGSTPKTLFLNEPPSPSRTAQMNAFLHVSRFRQFVVETDSSETKLDFQAHAVVNDSALSCNAAYFGGAQPSIRFSGETLLCSSPAFSTIVAHEMGHWANELFGSGNGPDGFGEGVADTWAMYIYDDPVVGVGFPGERTGLNTRQFCGDTNGGCYGEVHDDGEVMMGALWKVRAALNQALGNAAGDVTANVLFVSWLQAFDDTKIQTIVRDHWILLDDDDGNLTNGTPHFAQIDSGFVAQGFPPFQLPGQLHKLLPSQSGYMQFGSDVAMDGVRLVIGAQETRAVYAFEHDGTKWVEKQTLTPSGGSTTSGYGAAVALSGNRMAVSVPHYTTTESRIFTYVHNGSQWVLQATLTIPPGYHGTNANGLALDGSVLAVAVNDAVLVYRVNGSGWTQEALLKVWTPFVGYGRSVAVDGNRLAVGAIFDGASASTMTGAVWVYEWNGTAWVPSDKLVVADGAANHRFGTAVALDADRLVVGAVEELNAGTGRAYVFRKSGSSWIQEAKLLPSDGKTGDHFGAAVALDGVHVVIGAYRDDDEGADAGTVWRYRRSGTTWSLEQKMAPQELDIGDWLGLSVAVSSGRLAAGAMNETSLWPTSLGAVYTAEIP